MAPRLVPTITAETLGINSHLRLRESLAGLVIGHRLDALNVGAAIRRSLPPRIAPTLPRTPNLKGLVRR